MCKRKSTGSELGVPSSPTSPEVSEPSSGEWSELSSSSPASSVSYSSKMPNEGACVSSLEAEEDAQRENAPETKAMDLVGCPRCFMYVMLSKVDPKCPKCKSTVFLEFFNDENMKNDN